MQKRVISFFIFYCVAGAITFADEPIMMVYHERMPYVYFDTNHKMQGLVGAPVQQAFLHANVSLSWVEIPPNRQLLMLQQSDAPVCSLGWFKNEDREQYAQFSQPVYQDHPTIGLAKIANSNVPDETTVGGLFQQENLVLLTKAGYSYGAYIDKLITEYEPHRLTVTVENTSMLKMLAAGRVDYFFLALEEASQLIESQGLLVSDFKFVKLTDVPPGDNRYVICNQHVPKATLERVNDWLAKQAQDR